MQESVAKMVHNSCAMLTVVSPIAMFPWIFPLDFPSIFTDFSHHFQQFSSNFPMFFGKFPGFAQAKQADFSLRQVADGHYSQRRGLRWHRGQGPHFRGQLQRILGVKLEN
jgi:hypothetical protein